MSNEELALLIQQGQQQYIPQLYTQVEKFIRMKANSFYRNSAIKCSRCGVELDDLIQEGYFAMLEAVKGYKQENEYKFLTYIDYPFLNRYNTLIGNRTGRAKSEPLNNAKSLDEPLGAEDGTFTLSDTITDENSESLFDEALQKGYLQSLHDALEKGMEQLIPEQRTTIQCRYFEKQTLQKTADKIGCSRERVRQHEQKALRVFRKPKIARTLIPFLYDEMESYSLRGTGITAFKHTGASSTERTAEHIEQLERQIAEFRKQIQGGQ
jgi:RNA polymerase sporulation-specific sigma factor